MRSFVRLVDARSAATLIHSGASVVDARCAAAFAQGHLPGARLYAWQETTRDGSARGRIVTDLRRLETYVSQLGVENGRPALVYGDGLRGWGEEGHAAWLLALLGHSDIAMLDGGFAAWTATGRPVVPNVEPCSAVGFSAIWRGNLIAPVSVVGSARQIIDVRSASEFRGATPFGEARGGHIPSAVHLDWRRMFTEHGSFVTADAMLRLVSDAGVDPALDAVVYCTCGVRSALVVAALAACGVMVARNYDGSLAEWSSDPSAPMVR